MPASPKPLPQKIKDSLSLSSLDNKPLIWFYMWLRKSPCLCFVWRGDVMGAWNTVAFQVSLWPPVMAEAVQGRNHLWKLSSLYTMELCPANEEGWGGVICRKMDRAGDHVKQNNPESEKQIGHVSFHVWSSCMTWEWKANYLGRNKGPATGSWGNIKEE